MKWYSTSLCGITDLKPEEITVTDNGVKQVLTSFRLVQCSEAINQSGTTTRLDPLRQVRPVTLAFDAMNEPDQRKRARTAALDPIKGDQGANVFYSVVVIDTRLLVLPSRRFYHQAGSRTLERPRPKAEGGCIGARNRFIDWVSPRRLNSQLLSAVLPLFESSNTSTLRYTVPSLS